MTEPKQVSDFAKEYQKMYIALGQCKSAYDIVFAERDRWKKCFDIEHEAFMEFQKNSLKQLSALGELMAKHNISNDEIINVLNPKQK